MNRNNLPIAAYLLSGFEFNPLANMLAGPFQDYQRELDSLLEERNLDALAATEDLRALGSDMTTALRGLQEEVDDLQALPDGATQELANLTKSSTLEEEVSQLLEALALDLDSSSKKLLQELNPAEAAQALLGILGEDDEETWDTENAA